LKGHRYGLLASDIEIPDELIADLFSGLLVRPDGQEPGDPAGQAAQVAVREGLLKALDVIALWSAAGIGISFLEGDLAFSLENEFLALLDIDARVHPAGVPRNGELL
jgi:hypothetical protein